MPAFEYLRPDEVAGAVAMVSADPGASYLAGGTSQLDLLLKDGVVESTRLVDIGRLPLGGITRRGDTLHVGALTTMEELAADPTVTERVPLVREALLAGASTQLRNMATIGGNLLQRTRCRYFRDPMVSACNKRAPGSGCAAVTGAARMHAILGASHHCIALHASDLCVPLVALDAVVHLQGVGGRRSVPLTELYVLPGDRPDVENVLEHGELITRVDLPLLPVGARSGYLKVRDRASYEFAVASAAAVLQIEDGRITMARLALGGVGTVPWRARGRGAARRRTREPPGVPGRRAGRASRSLHGSGQGLQGQAGQADHRPLSPSPAWRMPRWCRPRSPPARSPGSTPVTRRPRRESWHPGRFALAGVPELGLAP